MTEESDDTKKIIVSPFRNEDRKYFDAEMREYVLFPNLRQDSK